MAGLPGTARHSGANILEALNSLTPALPSNPAHFTSFYVSKMAERPVTALDYGPPVAEFAVSKNSYLAARPEASFELIATSSLVLDTRDLSKPQVLLLQRAASDSSPNKWEPPGGACDDNDESILHAAARELWEEAGLKAARISGTVGDPHFFSLRDKRRVCQFNFSVFVKNNSGSPLPIKLDPNEHQQFVWATEDEVKAKKTQAIELDFTSDEVQRTVLQAFRISTER